MIYWFSYSDIFPKWVIEAPISGREQEIEKTSVVEGHWEIKQS